MAILKETVLKIGVLLIESENSNAPRSDGVGNYIDAARKHEPAWQGDQVEFKTTTLQELLLLRRNKCRLHMIVQAHG